MLGFFILLLLVGAVHQLLGFMGSLDNLSKKKVQWLKKKKNKQNSYDFEQEIAN